MEDDFFNLKNILKSCKPFKFHHLKLKPPLFYVGESMFKAATFKLRMPIRVGLPLHINVK
jgi:hypothetical protein